MQTRGVDPRDIKWKVTPSVYRVYFWSDDDGGSDEHELTEVTDVREVLKWVDTHARGRPTEVFVRHNDDRGQPGLIRLAGHRPGSV